MQLDLSGKIAVITGSTRGIGLAIARTLHTEGCKVVLNGRCDTGLNAAIAALPGSYGVVGDVSRAVEAKNIVDKVLGVFGRIDILICNVGGGRSVAPGDETPEEWQRVFALNLWSTTNIVEAAHDALIESKGVVVCISSICGMEVIPDAPVTYSAAKAALNAYVRGISRPFGKLGVRINAVAPGNILFDGSIWSRKLVDGAIVVHEMLEKEVALGALGSPNDVAYLVAYLASPRSKFTSGTVFTLDGGQLRS